MQTAASNSGTWGAGGATGDDLNTGVAGIIDTRLAEPATFSVSSSNVTLSYANVQSCMFRFTGTLLANIVVSPNTGGSPVAATYFNGMYGFENVTTGSFTITLTTTNGSVVLPQGRRGVIYVSNANTLAPRIVSMVGSSTADPIPAGSKTIWYNASAPSGWTAVALNDYAISIVTNGGGGVTSGSVAYSTLFARTATDAHTLTTAQIPSHQHFGFAAVSDGVSIASNPALTPVYTRPSGAGEYLIVGQLSAANCGPTGLTGGGSAHTHDIDMRLNTAAFVLATKD